jgi:hypothetical protein
MALLEKTWPEKYSAICFTAIGHTMCALEQFEYRSQTFFPPVVRHPKPNQMNPCFRDNSIPERFLFSDIKGERAESKDVSSGMLSTSDASMHERTA